MGRVWCEHGYSDDCPKCEAYAEAFGCVHQQRRYEIARDVMAGLALADFGHHDAEERESDKVLAKWSVEAADALLAELEKEPGS